MNEQVRLGVRRNNPAMFLVVGQQGNGINLENTQRRNNLSPIPTGRIPRPPPNSPVQRHSNQLQNTAGRQVENNNGQEPNNIRRPQVNSAEAPTLQNTQRLNQNNGNIVAGDFGAIRRRQIQSDDDPGSETPQAVPRDRMIPQIMINGHHLQQENGLAQEEEVLGTQQNAPPSDADNEDVAEDASVQPQQQNRQVVHEEMVPANRPQPTAATEPQNGPNGPPYPEPQNRLQDPDPELQNRLQDPDLEPQNRLQDPDPEPQNRLLEPHNRLQDPVPEPPNRLQNSNPEPQNGQLRTVNRNRPAAPAPQNRPPGAAVPRPPSRQQGMIRQTPNGQQTAQYGPVLGPQNRPPSVRRRPAGNQNRPSAAVVQNTNLAPVPARQRYRPQGGAQARSASEGATRGNERVRRARGRHRISLDSRPPWRY